MRLDGKIEAVVVLLFIGMVIGLISVFVAEKWFPSDGQIFQVTSSVVTTLLGALVGRIDPKHNSQDPPPPPPRPE